MSHHILIIDDDALLRRSLAFHLEQAGFRAEAAASAEDALALLQRTRPRLILLDLSLPGKDGLDLLKEIKNRFDLPVIILTARRRGLDQVVGLELGGDDYLTKPFDVDVLIAHIKAVLRRFEQAQEPPPAVEPVTVGDMVVEPATYTAAISGRRVQLTRREFDLLHTLSLHPGVILPTEHLLTQVWGPEFDGQPQVLYTHIRWLREKIEEDPGNPRRIQTVRGIGYKLVPLNGNSE